MQFCKETRNKWRLKDDVPHMSYSGRRRINLANRQLSLALFGSSSTLPWMNFGLGPLVANGFLLTVYKKLPSGLIPCVSYLVICFPVTKVSLPKEGGDVVRHGVTVYVALGAPQTEIGSDIIPS